MVTTDGARQALRPEIAARRLAGAARAILVVAMLVPVASSAQEYGQWSWTGSLGVGSRGVTSTSSGLTTEDWRADELRIFAGVNGIIVHPAIGAFELGGDLSIQSETEGLDVDRSGYRARVRLVPRSSVPVEIHASRASFEYGGSDGGEPDVPMLRRGTPDSITTLGGTIRVRKGILSGLVAGFESSETGFAGDESREGDAWERAHASWSGESGGVRHLVLVDRRSTRFGDLDYQYDELSVTIDERSRAGGDWTWSAVGNGYWRDFAYDSGVSGSTTLLRLLANATRRYESGRDLAIRYDGGVSEAGDADGALTQQLFADLHIPLGPRWTVVPYAGLNHATHDALRATIPQLGVSAAWSRSFGAVAVDVNGSLGVLLVDESLTIEGESFAADGDELAASAGIVVSRPHDGGLAQRLELAAARNEFSAAGDAIAGLPDIGIGITPPGFQDSARARYSLSRSFGSTRAAAWAEWGLRRWERERPGSEAATDAGTIEDLRLSFQVGGSRAHLLLNGGSTSIDETRGPQRVDFYSGSLSWRATRRVSVTASALHSNQQVALAPDIRFDRIDAGADLEAGLLQIGARAYVTRETRASSAAFDSRGLEVFVRRSFGGFLPIVSAPARRGVVK